VYYTWLNIKLLFSSKTRKKFFLFLQDILGFSPRNLRLYELAFIHKSASFRFSNGFNINNERLEYLGDAILDAIVADFLFIKYPNKDEGFLTQMRSKMVKRSFLDAIAVKIGISKLIVSHVPNHGTKKHLYGNAFEAFVGAVYLDRGYDLTRQFVINRIIKQYINLDDLMATESDFKSRLIEWAQKNKQIVNFECNEDTVKTERPPLFVAHIVVDEKNIGKGKGYSKKEAEQNAAQAALLFLNLKANPEIEQENSQADV
jgi:ribonuclease III